VLFYILPFKFNLHRYVQYRRARGDIPTRTGKGLQVLTRSPARCGVDAVVAACGGFRVLCIYVQKCSNKSNVDY
jgi:hypothetical protein